MIDELPVYVVQYLRGWNMDGPTVYVGASIGRAFGVANEPFTDEPHKEDASAVVVTEYRSGRHRQRWVRRKNILGGQPETLLYEHQHLANNQWGWASDPDSTFVPPPTASDAERLIEIAEEFMAEAAKLRDR